MYTIAIPNQKGGVGKTTTAVSLGVALEQKGKSSLIVDTDHQANTTYWMLDRELSASEPGLFEVLVEDLPARKVVRETEMGPDLIPASQRMANLQKAMSSHPYPQDALRKSLEPIREEAKNGSERRYDFCLLDPPANLGLRVLMVLRASDGVILPIVPEGFSIQGLSQMFDLITRVRESGLNEGLETIGILPNQLDVRRNLTQKGMQQLQESQGDLLFDTWIRQRAHIAEAASRRMSLPALAPGEHGDEAFQSLANEVINRTNHS